MLLQLFTSSFRRRLVYLARTVKGREARLLAVKLSPLFSVFGVVFSLQLFPGYGYLTLAWLASVVLLLGAVVAFAVPAPFIMLLRFIAVDFNEVVLWRGRGGGRRDES
jgi:hypothetical protein